MHANLHPPDHEQTHTLWHTEADTAADSDTCRCNHRQTLSHKGNSHREKEQSCLLCFWLLFRRGVTFGGARRGGAEGRRCSDENVRWRETGEKRQKEKREVKRKSCVKLANRRCGTYALCCHAEYKRGWGSKTPRDKGTERDRWKERGRKGV